MLVLIMAASFVATVFFCTLVTFCRKPDMPYLPGDFGRPTNILFHPDYLTEEGLVVRKLCFASILIFISSLMLRIVFAILES
jgi:hypothetical protein